MTVRIITDSYIKTGRGVKYMGLCLAVCLLSGCLGGSIAQQIARSIATSIADKTIANSMDVNESDGPVQRKSTTLANRPPSDLSLALMYTSFREAPTQTEDTIAQEIEKPMEMIKTNPLVRAKVFNIIIGQEREMVLDNARKIGALNLPEHQPEENWYVVMGEIENNKTPITFVVAHSLGKPISGSIVIVELANIGELNIARYNDSQYKVYQAMDATIAASH
jgi:hypothetical protein